MRPSFGYSLAGGFVTGRTNQQGLVATLGLLILAATALLVGTVDLGGVLLVLTMAVGGFFNGVIMPSRDMIVRSVTPPGSFGKVFGFVTTGFNIAGIVAPLVFGWMMDQGNPQAIFIASAAFGLASILTVMVGTARR